MRSSLWLGLMLSAAIMAVPSAPALAVLPGEITGTETVSSPEAIDPAESVTVKTGGTLANASTIEILKDETRGEDGHWKPEKYGGRLIFEDGSTYSGSGKLVVNGYGDYIDLGREALNWNGGVLIKGSVTGVEDLVKKAEFISAAVAFEGATVNGDLTVDTAPQHYGVLFVDAKSGADSTFNGKIDMTGKKMDLIISCTGETCTGVTAFKQAVSVAELDTHNAGTVTFSGTVAAAEMYLGDGTVTFEDDVSIAESFLGEARQHDSLTTLKAGKKMAVGRDFEMQGSGAAAAFRLEAGSSLEAKSSGYGLNIGTHYDNDGRSSAEGPDYNPSSFGQTASSLIVSANNSGNAVSIEADRYFHIFGKGEFIVEDNSAANISLNTAGPDNTHGYFLVGYADNNDLGLVDENGDPFPNDPKNGLFDGGSFKLGRNSTVTITGGGAYFGDGGTVDVGLNTLTVHGDAYYKSGSLYKVAVTENMAGQTIVSGRATIEDGAKISLYDENGADAGKIALGKTVLTAGSFADGQVFTNALYSLKIDGHDLKVESFKGSGQAVGNAVTAGGGSMNSNYVNASGLMDRVLISGGSSADLSNRLVGALETINAMAENGDAGAELALKQLIGEEALSAMNANIDTIQQVNATLGGRFNTLHEGHTAPAAGYGETLNRTWLSGFGTWTRQKNRGDIYGYDYDAGGVMLGYDREVEAVPGLTLGIAGAWSSGEIENSDSLATTDVDTVSFGLYGSYEFAGGFFIDGNVNYGHAENDADIKMVLGGRKKSSFDSDSWQMGLNLGYIWNITPETRLIPSVGLQYIHIKQDGWKEKIASDPNNLAVANWFKESKNDFLEIPVSLRLNSTFETQSGVTITPEVRIGGVFAADKPKSELWMGFAGSGDSAKIYGIEPGKNRFQAGGGVKIQISDLTDIYANYDFEGRSGYKAHSASGGLGFSF